DLDHVDADAPAPDSGDDGPQCRGGAPAPADDLAQVVRVHVHLDGTAPSAADEVHLDVVGIVHDAAHQVVHSVGDDLGVHLSAASADSPSSAFTSSAFASSASSAFLADFFLAVTASPRSEEHTSELP